jgi:hypothetical protein
MTAEQLTLLEPSDFRAFRVVCRKCRSAITIQFDETIAVPEECPICHNEWRTRENIGNPTLAEGVGNALKRWIAAEREKTRPFTIQVEISRP